MRKERWLRVKQLFDASRDLKPDERQAFLADACNDDVVVRAEVESLIESYQESGAFLEDCPQPSSWLAAGLEGHCI